MGDQNSLPAETELVRHGLSRAIQLHSEEFRVKNPHIKLDLDLVDDEKLLPEETCLALYHFYQESLERSRQAQAEMVWVRFYPIKQQMALEIKNDGTGPVDEFDSARLSECLRAVGGEVKVIPRAERGMVITGTVPLGR